MAIIRVNRNTGNFVGANWRKNYFLNRSFDRTAGAWRGWASTAARTGAATTIAVGSLLTKAGGHAYNIYKSLRRPRSKVDKSKLVPIQRPSMKRRGTYSGGARKRTRTYNDPASYKQLSSIYSKSGRKATNRSRAGKLWRALTTGVRYRHAAISDLSAPYGGIVLRHGPADAGNAAYFMPVQLFALANVNNNGSADGTNLAGYCRYELGMTAAGILNWTARAGVASDGSTARGTYQAITGEDTVVLGRKALLDWTRCKFCFYGKTKNPSTIRISLVTFTEDEYTPEYQLNKTTGIGAALSTKASEFWQSRLKPLINGPVADHPKTTSARAMRILKRWLINVNPIDASAETTASDPRGHMKHVDIFNRWNRVIDFTTPTGQNVDTYTALNNPNNTTVTESAFTGYPRKMTSGIYLLVESVTENTVAYNATAATMAETQVTFDYNVQTKYSTLQPFV